MTHADWLILGYTTVIIIFGIVCYIGLLKLITKGKQKNNALTGKNILSGDKMLRQ